MSYCSQWRVASDWMMTCLCEFCSSSSMSMDSRVLRALALSGCTHRVRLSLPRSPAAMPIDELEQKSHKHDIIHSYANLQREQHDANSHHIPSPYTDTPG